MVPALPATRPCIMGCTSSAPSMPPANATERNISFADEEEKPMEEIKEMVVRETQTQAIIEKVVLPMCDNLDEPILLSQSDKSTLETASQRLDKDVQTDSFRIDNENAWNESFRIMNADKEDNTPKLEEVVEKAVELLGSDSNTESARNTPEELTESSQPTESNEEPAPAETEPVEENYEHLEAMVSPSQSESSRATRWEALADIAAELPPSLAVDPLTGQIYSLSK